MKTKDVPQDESILEGNCRACYAEDENGRYVIVPSKGGEVEKIVNAQARAAIHHAVEEARQLVLEGKASPLKYHMAQYQMTVGLLAATAGLWRWQVRRHLRPNIFERVKQETLKRYADAFGIDVETLCKVPRQTQTNNPNQAYHG